MRAVAILLIPGLVLAACGPATLALPADPIDRAATCGVVAAARARAGQTDIKADLPFEAQGAIMHPAMLVAAQDEQFATATAAQIIERMPALENEITSGKFETLAEPCRQAFPETVKPVQLPADAFAARMDCYQLSGFLVRALKDTGATYADQLAQYASMRRDMDPILASALSAKGAPPKSDAAEKLRKTALSDAVKLGSPMEVVKACLAQYGGKT